MDEATQNESVERTQVVSISYVSQQGMREYAVLMNIPEVIVQYPKRHEEGADIQRQEQTGDWWLVRQVLELLPDLHQEREDDISAVPPTIGSTTHPCTVSEVEESQGRV